MIRDNTPDPCTVTGGVTTYGWKDPCRQDDGVLSGPGIESLIDSYIRKLLLDENGAIRANLLDGSTYADRVDALAQSLKDKISELRAAGSDTSVYTQQLEDAIAKAMQSHRDRDSTGAKNFSGPGVPQASLGADGDRYTDTNTGQTYIKTGGQWIASGQAGEEKTTLSLGRNVPCEVCFSRSFPSKKPRLESLNITSGVTFVNVDSNVLFNIKPSTIGKGNKALVPQGFVNKNTKSWAVEYEIEKSELRINSQGTEIEVTSRELTQILFYANTAANKNTIAVPRQFKLVDVTLPVRAKSAVEVFRKGIVNRVYPDSDTAMTGEEYWDVEQPTRVISKVTYEFIDPATNQAKGIAGYEFKIDDSPGSFAEGHYKKVRTFETGVDPTNDGTTLWL